MTPDPWCTAERHGDLFAYKTAGCRCPEAQRANNRAVKWFLLRRHRGVVMSYDATGTRRRIQALIAQGWPAHILAERIEPYLGKRVSESQILQYTKMTRVFARTRDAVAAMFTDMCMSIGPSELGRARAIAKGWVPALAWDDIDDPTAQPIGLPGTRPRELREYEGREEERRERRERVKALAREHPHNQIAIRLGIDPRQVWRDLAWLKAHEESA